MMSPCYHLQQKKCNPFTLLQLIVTVHLIANGVVQAENYNKLRKPPRRNASRSRRGLIDSLGYLDHTGKAADGWKKIQNHYNSKFDSPSVAPDRAGTTAPSTIEIITTGAPKTTATPTRSPTKTPTQSPTKSPSVATTKNPSQAPTKKPTVAPTKVSKTNAPTKAPTKEPTQTPTINPTKTSISSDSPIVPPSSVPSESPSSDPTNAPTFVPTKLQAKIPTATPTNKPSKGQEYYATQIPTDVPSDSPSSAPSSGSSINPLSPTRNPSPTSIANPIAAASNISDSAVLCPDVESSTFSKLDVWWKYSVHFDGTLNATSALQLFEMNLAAKLEGELLACRKSTATRRRLEKDGSIVGIDYLPLDEKLEEVCPGVSANCAVYRGTVSIYLLNDASSEDTIQRTRRSIIDLMSEYVETIAGEGISMIEYLSPDLQTSAAKQGPSNENVAAATDKSISTPTAIIASLGVVCVVIALSVGYRYKNRLDDAGLSTIGPCGSQLTMTSSYISGESGSACTPGLSSMMPNQYRLGESHCMNAILEGDSSDTSSQARNVSIVVSESGYSDVDSNNFLLEATNSHTSGDHLLGAERPCSAYRMDVSSDEQLFHDSFSDIQPPSDSSFDESNQANQRRQDTVSEPSTPTFQNQDGKDGEDDNKDDIKDDNEDGNSAYSRSRDHY